MEIETKADRRLPNTDVVLALLKWIERFMIHRKPRYCATAAISTNLLTPAPSPVDPMKTEVELDVF